MSSNPDQNHNFQVLCTLTWKRIHDLPPCLPEYKLLETSVRAKRRPFKTLCSLILERLFTFQEGSEFLMEDICRAFPEKNVSTSIYHLFNVLEGLGYMTKVKHGDTKALVWYGRESYKAVNTLKDLKTVAIKQEGIAGSVSGDTKIARLTEEVLMIFLSISPLNSISTNQIFFLIFNREYDPRTTASCNMLKVLSVFEVLGIITPTGTGTQVNLNYHYTGPTVDSHASLEDIGKFKAEDNPLPVVKDDVVGTLQEMVLGTDGSWIIQDYIPVSGDDNIHTSVKEDETPGNKEEQKSVRRDAVCQIFGLVDVKDEILKDN